MTELDQDNELIDFAMNVYEDILKTQLKTGIDILTHRTRTVIEDDDIEDMEYYIGNNKKDKAVDHYLEKFKKKDDKMKYTELWDFAKETNPRLQKILSLNISTTTDKEKEKKWLDMIHGHLKDFLDIKLATTDILSDLAELKTLPLDKKELIDQILMNKGNIKAIHELLSLISQYDDNWYVHFLTVLYRAGVDVAFKLENRLEQLGEICDSSESLEILSERIENILQDYPSDDENTAAASLSSQDVVDSRTVENQAMVTNVFQLNIKESLSFIQNDLGARDDPEGSDDDGLRIDENSRFRASRSSGSGPMDLELRPYQEELAFPGLAGQNCVVFAPTGSGKTHVAIKVALEHLKTRAESASTGKVAFLVPSKPLAGQQSNLFSNYLRPRFKVGDLIGGENATITPPLPEMMEDHDVIIMTAQIVVNSLKSKFMRLESIRKFSMIIFDECHHCEKKHPYNEIMMNYFDDREAGHRDLPQILGLTASLGTNKAQNVEEARQHILDLLSNLDMHSLKSVQEQRADLLFRNNQPDDQIIYCDAKPYDLAGQCLEELMKMCENKAIQIVTGGDKFSSIAAPKRGCQEYTNFVNSDLARKSLTLTAKEDRIIMNSCIKCLDVYNRAYIMSRLIRSKDAKEYILQELWTVDYRPSHEFEQKMKQAFVLKQDQMFDTEEKNPALEALKETINRQFYETKDSRVLIFVKERAYTTALCDWFRETLPDINIDVVVGAQASATTGGQTQNTQQAVLNKFRNGFIKVVICTSVLEEGLDVPECNLVIRYGYVTNETAMVQTKGRGRAIDAKYIVIVPRGEEWLADKEKINKKRNEMMNEAAEIVSKMSPEKFRNEMKQRQTMTMKQRTLKMKAEAENVISKNAKKYRLECVRCGEHACNSDEIRKAENAHHVVIGDKIVNRISVKQMAEKVFTTTKISGTIMCAKCQNRWGSLIYYRDTPFPNIAISNFVLINLDNKNDMIKKKKWKDAPFNVQEIEIDEIIETMDTRGSAWVYDRIIDSE